MRGTRRQRGTDPLPACPRSFPCSGISPRPLRFSSQENREERSPCPRRAPALAASEGLDGGWAAADGGRPGFRGERESNTVTPPKESAFFSAVSPRGRSPGSPDGPRSCRSQVVEAAGSSASPGWKPPLPGGPGSLGTSPHPGSPGPPPLAFTLPSPQDQISSHSLGLQSADAGSSPPDVLVPTAVPGSQDSIPRSGQNCISWVNRIEGVLGRGKEAKPALMGAGQRWVTLHLSNSHARGQRGFRPPGTGGAAGLGAHNFPARHLRWEALFLRVSFRGTSLFGVLFFF